MYCPKNSGMTEIILDCPAIARNDGNATFLLIARRFSPIISTLYFILKYSQYLFFCQIERMYDKMKWSFIK